LARPRESIGQPGKQSFAHNLRIDSFNLMGTSFGGKTALWLAAQQRERVPALVLEAPAAIRPKGAEPPSG
jgi:pimeloyl-ACP methyl ester carboxylesterase